MEFRFILSLKQKTLKSELAMKKNEIRTEINLLSPEIFQLGECPLWRQDRNELFSIDVENRELLKRKSSGILQRTKLQRRPASFGWRKNGLVFAFRNGLALTDFDAQVEKEIKCPQIDFGSERFNDGAVDKNGFFWIGSFNPRFEKGAGSLYRLDHNLKLHKAASGFTMSNGIAWSLNGNTMYLADSRPGKLFAFDFNLSNSEVGNRRILIDYSEEKARPDGITVDAENCIWVSEVEAGRVARYSPDGTLISVIKTPVSKPTSLTFGGEDFQQLFITSMRVGLTNLDLKKEPNAGGTFHCSCKVTGLPEPIFGQTNIL